MGTAKRLLVATAMVKRSWHSRVGEPKGIVKTWKWAQRSWTQSLHDGLAGLEGRGDRQDDLAQISVPRPLHGLLGVFGSLDETNASIPGLSNRGWDVDWLKSTCVFG